MAIDAAHRSSIYRKLVPVLGEEDANIVMSEFPSVEAQELVTKDFLRAELAITRGDLRAEIAELRAELRGEMGELGSSLRAEIAALETRLTTRLGAAIGASTALLATVGIFT